jgi:hypothetical protein
MTVEEAEQERLGHDCPACGAQHRYGWLFEHTCGHNGCEHKCTQIDTIWSIEGPREATITAYEKLFLRNPLPSGDNPLHG